MYNRECPPTPCDTTEQYLSARQSLRKQMFERLLQESNSRTHEDYSMGTAVVKAIEMADKLLDTPPATTFPAV